MLNLHPLRDAQDVPSVGTCARCGCELYSYDKDGLCDKCRTDLEPKYDTATVSAFMAAMDEELKKWLSDDLRNTVWNAMVNRFPAA